MARMLRGGQGMPERPLIRTNEARRWAATPAPYIEGSEQDYSPGASGLSEYWRTIRRWKGTVLLIAFLGVAAGILVTLPQTPVYRAKVSLEVQGINENFLNLRDVNPTAMNTQYSPDYDVQTQVRVLQSQALIERAVKAVGLEKRPQLAKRGGRLESWKRAFGIDTAAPAPLEEQVLATIPHNLNVRSVPNTRLIEVVYDSTDPAFAADFANVLAREFIDQNLEARWQTTQHTGDWMTRQLQELKIKLEKAQDEMQRYGRASGLLFTGEKENSNVAEDKLKQLQEELSRAQADRVAKQSRFEQATLAPADTLPEVLDARVLQDYQSKLTELRQQMSELASVLTPAHPKVEKLAAQIQAVEREMEQERARIMRRIKNEYQAAQRREELLAAAYQSHARLMTEQAGPVSHYNILKREVDTTRQLYESMFQRVKEAGVASALRASNIRVIDTARPPKGPYKPNLPLNSMLGLFTGAICGIGIAVMRERADRTIQEPGDSAQLLNVSELAVIPLLKAEEGGRLLGPDRGSDWARVTAAHRGYTLRIESGPTTGNAEEAPAKAQVGPSLLANSFRTALTSILFCGQNGERPRVLVLSSANPGEGKSTFTANLGISIAEINMRVLLIDGDLRRPRLHDIFQIENSKGFAEALRQPPGSSVAGFIQATTTPGLFVMPSGSVRPTTLLYSQRLPELIATVRNDFDMVLIDTPPILQIPDARVLGRCADAVILVVRAARTTRDEALLACDRLAEDGTEVLGTILNAWDPRRSVAYGYSNYGHYSRYHDKDESRAG
ncbi:MAG TPA: polysaccharide biosynthesis tyrosine autokinase [Bryobacteraceae bacterium]|nr:polysaccharide biosynthesis tyrosine autokinase [Bryobacteraceae bacterium]